MVASDIDEASLHSASTNVTANDLGARIKLLSRRDTDMPLIPLDELGMESLDFTMTNPPFYSSREELLQAAKAKARPPNSACTGADVEMVYGSGGEVGFVRRIVDESTRLGSRVQWYSSMLGKLGSVGEVVCILREKGCTNWCVAEFVQGNRTRRWAVAWSWTGFRPAIETARGSSGGGQGVERAWLPWPSEVQIEVPGTLQSAGGALQAKMESLELEWRWKDEIKTGIAFASGNVWSRVARRKKTVHETKRRKIADEDDEMEEDDSDDEPALAVKMEIRQMAGAKVRIHVRWLVGKDSVLFESFCGMLKRSLSDSNT